MVASAGAAARTVLELLEVLLVLEGEEVVVLVVAVVLLLDSELDDHGLVILIVSVLRTLP